MQVILNRLQEILRDCLSKQADLDSRLSALTVRETEVKDRELRISGIESAQVLINQVNQVRVSNEAEAKRLEEERVKFKNLMAEERQAIANEYGRLAPLQDQEKQLFKEKHALYDAQRALEQEKKEFKQRYIDKIKAHFANTGSAPDPNDIT